MQTSAAAPAALASPQGSSIRASAPAKADQDSVKTTLTRQLLLLVIDTYAQGFRLLCGMKEGDNKHSFIKRNFVSVKSVRKENEEFKALIDAVHQIILNKLRACRSEFFDYFSGAFRHYFILRGKLSDFLEAIRSSPLLIQWRDFLEDIREIAKGGEEDRDPLMDIPAFVADFNKNYGGNRAKYRSIALQKLDELKYQVWYNEKGPSKTPNPNVIPAVRKGIFELYKCEDPDIKQTALRILIEILDSDPIEMESAFDLVELQQTLLEQIRAVKAQNLNTRLLRLLIKAYALSLECILLHQAARHLNALTEETKLAIWDGASELSDLNVIEDYEIKFWSWYAIQAAQHIKSDKPELSIWLGRVGKVVQAGIKVAASAWGDAANAPQNLDGAFEDMKAAISHLEWHEQSFEDLLILKKLCRYSMNTVEMFRRIIAILQSKVIEKGEDDLFYGIIATLEDAAINSHSPEVQEESIKLLIQYLGIDNPKIQIRVLFAFTQMLPLKNRVGNTAHVVIKLLHACGRFQSRDDKLLIENDITLQKRISFHLARMNTKGIREGMRDTYYMNVLKFLLRRLAFIKDGDFGGQSLVTMLVSSDSEHILPPLLKCLREYATDLIQPDVNGYTPFHTAAAQGKPAMILCFHQCIPGNLNLQEYQRGMTPLHLAVLAQSEDAVRVLLELGADPDIANFEGNTPLHLAVDLENEGIASLISRRVKEPNKVNKDGKTALNIAVEGDSVRMTQLLIPRKAQIAEHSHQFTPVCLAAKHSSEQVLRHFLTFSHVHLTSSEALEIIRMISADGSAITCTPEFFQFHLKHMSGSSAYAQLFQCYPQWTQIICNTPEGYMRSEKSQAAPAERKEKAPLHRRMKSVPPPEESRANYEEIGNNTLIQCACRGDPKASEEMEACDKKSIDQPNWVGITALSAAVVCRNSTNVQNLLRGKADVNAPEVRGYAPLHWAVYFHYPELLELLLGAGNIKVDARTDWGDTPFLLACGLSPDRMPDSVKSVTRHRVPSKKDESCLVERLLKAGASHTETDILGNNALHHAFAWGGPCVIGFLMSHFQDLFWKPNAIGILPIQLAINLGKHENVRAFLRGLKDNELLKLHQDFIERTKNLVSLPSLIIKVHAFDCFERLYRLDATVAYQADSTPQQLTPLHYAAKEGDEEVLQFYLKAQLSMEVRDSHGQTAAHYAVLGSHQKCVEILAAYPPLWNIANRDLRTPLHFAATKGDLPMLRTILAIPGIANNPDGHGDFPLHHASKNGHTQAAELLCNAPKEDVELRNDDGNTPAHLACVIGHAETVEMLLQKGADLEARNTFGATLGMLAALHGHSKLFARLLALHADAHVKDQDGETTMHKAAMNSHPEIVEILLVKERTLIRSDDELLIHTYDTHRDIPLMELAKKEP